jgi:hypothetical protein
MGPRLTSAAPEAAPGAVSTGDAATLKSNYRSDHSGFIRRWRHAVLRFYRPDSNSTIFHPAELTMVSSMLSVKWSTFIHSPPSPMQAGKLRSS